MKKLAKVNTEELGKRKMAALSGGGSCPTASCPGLSNRAVNQGMMTAGYGG